MKILIITLTAALILAIGAWFKEKMYVMTLLQWMVDQKVGRPRAMELEAAKKKVIERMFRRWKV